MWVAGEDYRVTETRITQYVDGDTDSTCKLTLIDRADSYNPVTGAPVIEWNTTTVGNYGVVSDYTAYDLSALNVLQFKVEDGSGNACSGTDDPYIKVELYGYTN
jgi:hypothetical protein